MIVRKPLMIISIILGCISVVAAVLVEPLGWTIFFGCLAAAFFLGPFLPVVVFGIYLSVVFLCIIVLGLGWLKFFGDASSSVMAIADPVLWSSLVCMIVGPCMDSVNVHTGSTSQPTHTGATYEEVMSWGYGENKKSGNEASVVGRAVVGGIIAGPAGAVVGALSAVDKNNKTRNETNK